MNTPVTLPLELRVYHRESVALESVRLDFCSTASDPRLDPLPKVAPGSNIALKLGDEIRRYSLINREGDVPGWSICVQRSPAPGGCSHFIHDHIRVGDTVTALEVASDFHLVDGAPHHVFIAGGIGITPFFSMIEHCEETGQSWALHYVVRDEARRISLPPGWEAKLKRYLGRGEPQGLDIGKILAETGAQSHVYVCGPVNLIDEVRRIAPQAGIAPSHIHSESFGQRSSKQDKPIRVELVQSAMQVDVAPGTTILDALLEAGVWAPFDCKRGACGACLTEVVAGVPLHRDSLEASVRGTAMCTCVSWAGSETLSLNL